MSFWKNKKIIGTSLVAAMFLSATVGAFVVNNRGAKADSVDKDSIAYEDLLAVMDTVSKECASDFVESIDEEVEVKDTTPIYSMYDNVIGYSVALSKGNQDFGYINIDYTSDGLVTDFSMEEDSRSMYTALTENFDDANDSIEAEECKDKLISTNGMDFAVEAVDSDSKERVFYYNGTTYESDDFEDMLDHYEENYLEYYDNIEYEDNFVDEEISDSEVVDGETEQKSIKERFINWLEEMYPKLYNKFLAKDGYIAPTKYPDHDQVFKNETICEIDTEKYLECYSPEESLLSQREVMTTTNRYACELVGIAAICQQEGMKLNGNLKDTFNTLWDLAGCETRIYQTGTFYEGYTVDCSSTYSHHMGGVLKEYAKNFNKNVDTKYKDNPKFEEFKNSIDAENSTSFGYSIAKQGGHGVNVVGYAQGNIGIHDINYIITGDSWYDDAPRYVLYRRGLFQSSCMNSFTITDL